MPRADHAILALRRVLELLRAEAFEEATARVNDALRLADITEWKGRADANRELTRMLAVLKKHRDLIVAECKVIGGTKAESEAAARCADKLAKMFNAQIRNLRSERRRIRRARNAPGDDGCY